MAAKTKQYKLTSEQYDSLAIVVPSVVISHPHLFEMGKYEGKDTNYNCTLLIPKKRDMKEIRQRLTRAKIFTFGKDQNKWPQNTKRKHFWNPAIKDGDKMEKYPDYAGFWVITATSSTQPPVVGPNGQEILNAKEVYGGMIAHVHIQAATYEVSDKNLGEKFYLKAVKKIADGKRLGNGSAALKAFDAISDDLADDIETDSGDAGNSGEDDNDVDMF
jgi:hypothetical protein